LVFLLVVIIVGCSDDNESLFKPGNLKPDPPNSPTPRDGSSNQPRELVLSWSCSDPDDDSLLYDVYFGINYNPEVSFPLVSEAQTDTFYHLDNLDFREYYRWRINANDRHGHISRSPIWEFEVTPAIPVLVDYCLEPDLPVVRPGESFTACYFIYNPCDFDIQLHLEAYWAAGFGSGKINPSEVIVHVAPDTNWVTRRCTVDSLAAPEVYSFAWGFFWWDMRPYYFRSDFLLYSFEVIE